MKPARLLFLLFACVAAWLLVACSSTSEPQTVTFMVSGDPAERDAYQKLVDAFQASHADIKIEMTHIPDDGDYLTRLVTDFAAGNPTDVSLFNYRQVGNFAAQGVLEPIGPYLDKSTVIHPDDFYATALQAYNWQGTIMCLPQNASSLVVYYNKDLFAAAGVAEPGDKWSWADFLLTAQQLTKDTDGDGAIDQYGVGVGANLQRLAPFIWQNNGLLTDSDTAPTRLTLNRPPTLEALQWFVDLQVVHGVVPGRVEEEAMDSESRFIAGTTAMFLNSRRATPTFREITAFKWDVAPLPDGQTSASILHSDGYCLSKASTHKEAAWTFIEFANSPEGQKIIASTGRTVPSLKSVAESDAFLDPSQAPSRSHVFIDVIPILRTFPLVSSWSEIEGVANEEIKRAFYGDITAEEAANLVTQRTEEYFLTAQFGTKP